MVEHFTNYQLAAAVFILRNGNVPRGGICDLQVYLDELKRRGLDEHTAWNAPDRRG